MLIKNGTIINYNQTYKGDIRIQGEKIVDIGDNITPLNGEPTCDAKGCYIIPGGIDVHTHVDMLAGAIHTSDDFYSGTRAAVCGGTTTIIDFAETGLDSPLQEGLTAWHDKAGNKSFCDYGFHMTIPRWDDSMEQQIKDMIGQGITSFKVYTAYKHDFGVEDSELYRIFEAAAKLQVRVCIHCENGEILECRQSDLRKKDKTDIRNHPLSRPNLVEKEAVSRVIDMAELLGTAIYIVHISTAEAVKEVVEAKERGVDVFGETCPHYLLLNEEKYCLPDFESAKYVMSPPLRKEKDQKALWQGVKETAIDVVSTDHCSFNYIGQKDAGKGDFTKIPNGIPSVEQRMELMLHYGKAQGMSLEDVVRVTSANPAKIFGLYPQKGVIQVGSDADLLIVRDDAPHVISAGSQHQQVDYTPYEGMTVSTRIKDVFLRGEKLVSDGQLVIHSPGGRFLHRSVNK